MTLDQSFKPTTPPPLPASAMPAAAAPLPAAKSQPKRTRLSPYVAAWSIIGLLAAAYLTALAVRPDLVSEYLPAFRPGEPETNQGQRAMSKAVAEVQTLRQSVSQVQLDVAKMKAAVATTEQRQDVIEKTLGARLTTLEEKITFNPPNVAAARPGTTAPAAKQTSASAASAVPAVAEAPLLAPAAAAKAASPIETGSIASSAAPAALPEVINAKPSQQAAVAPAPAPSAAAPVTPAITAADPPATAGASAIAGFGPAIVTPAQEPVGLRISNGSSLDALRLSWSLLADRHAPQLKNLEPRYVTRAPGADGEPSFDLVAGPVKSQAEAKRICKALAAKNIPCQIGSFEGAGL